MIMAQMKESGFFLFFFPPSKINNEIKATITKVTVNHQQALCIKSNFITKYFLYMGVMATFLLLSAHEPAELLWPTKMLQLWHLI